MDKKVTKQPRMRTLVVPVDPNITPREVVVNNGQVFHVLKKNTNADIYHYAVPDKEGGIFLRRIRVVKSMKAEIGCILDDLPDLSDMHDASMPWAGHVTLKDASRQFNAKFVLATVVDIIVEFENVLYNLNVFHDTVVPPLQLFDLTRASRVDTCHTVSIRDDIPIAERQRFYEEPNELPTGLVALMEQHGYHHVGGFEFKHPMWQHSTNGRINCVPYGVIREVISGERHVQVRVGA